MAAQKIRVDALSLTSVYLKLGVNGHHLATATGIIVENESKFYLVTNRHVLSGRNPETGEPMSPTAGIPDEVRIAHHIKSKLGEWRFHGAPICIANGQEVARSVCDAAKRGWTIYEDWAVAKAGLGTSS